MKTIKEIRGNVLCEIGDSDKSQPALGAVIKRRLGDVFDASHSRAAMPNTAMKARTQQTKKEGTARKFARLAARRLKGATHRSVGAVMSKANKLSRLGHDSGLTLPGERLKVDGSNADLGSAKAGFLKRAKKEIDG